MTARLELIEGGGDVVAAIEHFLELAKAGKIDGVVLCAAMPGPEKEVAWTWAHGPVESPWPRLTTAAGCAHQTLLTEGLI